MRVLVTGGAGYIGSHTARQLARNGHEVLIYDNLSTGHRFLAGDLDFVFGDIADRGKLQSVLDGIDGVLHFAADSFVAESVRQPRKYFENNVRAGLVLLELVLEAKVRYFIHSSSCSVYGVPACSPITEDTPRAPINPYGATKLALENALEAYGHAYGLRFVNLRYFNAAGADEGGEIGELHDPETHLLPRALEAAAGSREQLEIYGTDYATPDGTCIRDYIHVNDLAAAHALALDYLARGGDSVSLNLGTGAGHSILDVLAMVEEVTGSPVAKRFCGRRTGDPPVLVADSRRAAQLLAWQPSRSLREMVATAWKWTQTVLVRKKASASRAEAEGWSAGPGFP